MLGDLLHSYGYDNSRTFWMYFKIFVAIHVVVIALGCLPRRFWRTWPGQE